MNDEIDMQGLVLNPITDAVIYGRSWNTRTDYGMVVARLRSAIQAAGLWIITETDLRNVLQRGGYTSCAVCEFVFSHPRIINDLSSRRADSMGDALLRLIVTDSLTDGVTIRWTCPKANLLRYADDFFDNLGEQLSDTIDEIIRHIITRTGTVAGAG